jgi:hypothetical protein
MEEKEIINRVASSPIVTLDLEEYYHNGERLEYDIVQNLYQGLMLREKDFREFIKANDWSVYQGKNVALHCSADAIVPTWAYMLLATKISPFANKIVFGGKEVLEYALFKEAIEKINFVFFENKPVVIKGCGDLPVPNSAYVEITTLLIPIAKSIMYGEPCSTVPLFKKSAISKS